jgi:hypothetical protein
LAVLELGKKDLFLFDTVIGDGENGRFAYSTMSEGGGKEEGPIE